MERIEEILEKFASSGWELIADPSAVWLEKRENTPELIEAIKQADSECGSCGCELDDLYKDALELLS
ncbi:MAG: hypothetical protein FWG30_08155 [Eubacteriaceae bacterium]|nr:hypothetical protein [Eubacteriaceae bacterium]